MPPPPPPGAFDRPPAGPPSGFDRPPQAPQGFQAPPPPSRDSYGPGPEFERPAPAGNTYGAPVTPPPAYGGAPQGGVPQGGFTSPPAPAMNGPAAGMTGPGAADVQRVDQMRRTFQLRRFGSGYDPSQVDRLFEGVIGALAGQPGAPIGDNELDPAQFSLVPGGYYEAEVDAALREVRDIVRRH
jgi:hypothetical protein